MQRLWINGWHAGMEGVGQGVYAQRLLAGFARYADSAPFEMVVLVPEQRAEALAKQLHPLRVEGRPHTPRANAIFNAMDWHLRFFALSELRDKHARTFSPGAGWGLRAPPHLALTWHDCINRHFPVYMGRRFIRAWAIRRAERFLRHAQAVFTESEHAAHDISQFLNISPKKISVIPAWLPPEYSPDPARARVADVRAKYHLPERYWLYVGGFDVRKNVEFLIRAYSEARQRRSCPPLVLAGRIPTNLAPTLCDIAGAERAAGLNNDTLIKPGFIDNADLPGLYAGAELFVYPSLMEGYGLPPMEAMGCGCPAVVADNSSLREVVTDTDYRFSTDSAAQLCELLITAAINPLSINPSFKRSTHDEAFAISNYYKALTELGSA